MFKTANNNQLENVKNCYFNFLSKQLQSTNSSVFVALKKISDSANVLAVSFNFA